MLPPPLLDPTDRRTLVADFQCASCKYNLRTLTIEARCPECGMAVSDSLYRAFALIADKGWLGTIQSASVVGAMAAGILLLSPCLFFAWPLILMGLYVFSFIAAVGLTTIEPQFSAESPPAAIRPGCYLSPAGAGRILVLIFFLSIPTAIILSRITRDGTLAIMVLFLVTLPSGIGSLISVAWRVTTLIRRLNSVVAARPARYLSITLAFLFVLLLAICIFLFRSATLAIITILFYGVAAAALALLLRLCWLIGLHLDVHGRFSVPSPVTRPALNRPEFV